MMLSTTGRFRSIAMMSAKSVLQEVRRRCSLLYAPAQYFQEKVLFDAKDAFAGSVQVVDRTYMVDVDAPDCANSAGRRLRLLRFGNHIIQSAMDLDYPAKLVVDYVQMMSLACLFTNNFPPKRILLLGCGGGSIARTYQTLFPDCEIHIVDISPIVCNVAFSHFDVHSANTHYHVSEAMTFLRSSSAASLPYDIVFVDLFAPSGPAPVLYSRGFLDSCRSMVAQWNGVLCMNLWYSARPSTKDRELFANLQRAFGNNLVNFVTPDGANAACLGIAVPKGGSATVNAQIQSSAKWFYHLGERLYRLEMVQKDTGVDLRQYLTQYWTPSHMVPTLLTDTYGTPLA